MTRVSPPRRRRHEFTPRDEPFRGLEGPRAEQPAAEWFASVPWDGRAPDPATLDARTYLSWL